MRAIGLVLASVFVSCWPAVAAAAEICGVRASTFADGFEAGAQAAYTPPPESTPLAVTVDSGIDGSTVAGARVVVSGTYTGPANTGIVVGRVIAVRSLGRWRASVPVAAGVNTIEVKASRIAGAPLTRTIRVTRAGAAEAFDVDIVARRFAPATARLVVAPAAGVTVTRVRADFDGDGRVDVDRAGAADNVTFTYPLPGAFAAVVDVDGTRAGTTVSRRIRVPVVIEHAADTRYALCGAFGDMRARLVARDVPGATLALLPRLRADFSAYWTALAAGLPAVATGLGTIADGTIGSEGSAELLVVRPDPAQPDRSFAFRVAFERDADGVWRISGM